MPQYETVTVWHLRDLACSKRLRIPCKGMKLVQLPLFEGLYTEDLLGFAKQWQGGRALEALPEVENEIHKLTREYLANVLSTLAGQEFIQWKDARIAARNARIKDDKDMMIDLDQEIADIF